MRAVIQRVTRAEVSIAGITHSQIGQGLLVLLGVHQNDSEKDVTWMADKLVHLRIFADQHGLMNRSIIEVEGEMLIVSQFTLFGDCRKGRRPSWSSAADPEKACHLYELVVGSVRNHGILTSTGKFQAMMQVSLVNDGPVTLLLDSHKKF